MPAKACPVVIRTINGCLEVLAFRHPLAGKQYVKGTIEKGETVKQACERELFEEAGLVGEAKNYLGQAFVQSHKLTYGFYLMSVDAVIPNVFNHFCEDDGGHVFEFFWHPLHSTLDENWHPIFHEIHEYFKNILSLRAI